MKTIAESRRKWNAHFRANDTPSKLRSALKSEQGGTLCSDGLRSIYWKAFLLFDDLDSGQWPRKIAESRSAYCALRSHFLKYIEHPDDLQSLIDPLADDEESPWQTLRSDEKIRADISQDVDRCLQENFFFREPTNKAKMVDILFIYCKLNPDLGYRQGMHELLAPILWVVDRDSVDAKPGSGTEGDLLLQLLDPTYIEHDAFALFCRIMQTARIYYEYSQQSTAGGQVDTIPIVDRCQHIHNDLLMAADPELGVHMQALEILPQIFLTRWMRLLFGREFPFEDALLVWDLLFASGLEQDLVDFVCVAMLLRIRWQLMNADHSSALSMLLRYHSPHPHAPQTFIHDALYLQQDLSPERGGFIISNYSGIPPEFLKKLSQPHVRPTAARKPIRDGFRDRSEGSSPARSPAGNEPRGFEGLLQDVSEEIQRRTETWGVAKAVRGAVTDARRNMHTMQWERPRATRPNDKSPFAQRDGRWTQEPKAATPDLKTRIELLEQRNKALAKLLGEALNDLRAQEGEVEGVDTSANDVMKKAVARVELIQICLEDSSIPVDTADLHSSENDAGPGTAQDEQPSTDKTDQPGRPAMASGRQQKDQAGSSKPDEPAISAPSRSAARPSLAESEFSWMLGRDRHLSGFASSASLPPEQTRHADSKTTANPLFGNGDEGQRRGSTESDVAMNSLRGRMAR